MSDAALVPPSLEQIHQRQLDRLRVSLREILRSNSFYRDRLHDVRTWQDFERLPFTTKAELMANQLASPPFGTNLTYPLERYVRMHQTSGTSGTRPLRWLDTAESWEWWTRIWAEHVFGAARVGQKDRVFLAFSFGPFIGFWSAFSGAERIGALVISGGGMTTEQRLRTMLDLDATIICCTPTYALRLSAAAAELGMDLAGSAIRATIHAGEPGASIPATRDAIEAAFGARCYDHTGMTELGPTGVSCDQSNGVHLIESEFVVEVIDQDGRTMSAAPVAEGELVMTNLGRVGSPVIRYRTGDRVRLTREPCPCGNPFPRLEGGILGRVDDMFTVRGVNLYPSQVEAITRRHPQVLEWRIEVGRRRQMDEVTLLFESESSGRNVAATLATELRQALGARIECRRVERGSLPRAELKSNRLHRV